MPKPADFIPEPVFPDGHPRAGKPRCQAWSSRLGRQCSQPPVKGKKVCRFHGGASPRGIKSGAYKHGRYSKSLQVASETLAEAYESALENPESLLSVNDELALQVAQIQQALSNNNAIGVNELARLMLELQAEALKAIRKNDADKLENVLVAWKRAASAAIDKAVDWKFVNERVEEYRRLVETQQKIAVSSEKSMPVEQVMLIIGVIISHYQDAITAHVKDVDLAGKIIDIAAQKTNASLSKG